MPGILENAPCGVTEDVTVMMKENSTASAGWLREQFASRRDAILHEYFEFLRFPSISADPAHRDGVLGCAEWLAGYLRKMGFTVEFWETSGYPTLFAEWNQAGPGAPTVMIYNHYDVQPVDPLEKWSSPPFEPTIRNGQVYARGAQDNKGQCWYAVSALKTLLETEGRLPVNVKLVIEGEEELGSIGLAKILESHRAQLAADHLLVLDCCIPSLQHPAVTLGLRGFVGLEIELTGSKFDLHSGAHGGVAYNPNHAMVELLAKLRDGSGRIGIPGFYDEVVPLTDHEKSVLFMDFDEDLYRREFGAAPTGGEQHLPPNERRWTRPCLEVNSFWGGYIGAGIKTIIPAKANARISCRLVPDQDPHRIGERLELFLRENCPPGFELSIHKWPGVGWPVRTSSEAEVVRATAKGYEEACGIPCKFILEGWSVPVVAELAAVSGAEIALAGFGLSSDAIHAPNEHFGLDRLELGYIMTAKTLNELAREKSA